MVHLGRATFDEIKEEVLTERNMNKLLDLYNEALYQLMYKEEFKGLDFEAPKRGYKFNPLLSL